MLLLSSPRNTEKQHTVGHQGWAPGPLMLHSPVHAQHGKDNHLCILTTLVLSENSRVRTPHSTYPSNPPCISLGKHHHHHPHPTGYLVQWALSQSPGLSLTCPQPRFSSHLFSLHHSDKMFYVVLTLGRWGKGPDFHWFEKKMFWSLVDTFTFHIEGRSWKSSLKIIQNIIFLFVSTK